MTHTSPSNILHKGFTLIELSIVLVIISLIVGGVIGGKSLIESAKLQTVIRDVSAYQTAWNNFKLQYDNIPGDFSEALDYWNDGCLGGNVWCDGNGNNLISSDFDNNSEGVAAMRHLKLAGILEGPLAPGEGYGSFRYPSPTTSHNSSTYHHNVPTSDAGTQQGKDGWVFASHATNSSGSEDNWYGRQGNWLMLGSVTQTRLLDGAILTQRQARIIDKKSDDGFPSTGNVTASTGSSSSANNTTTATPNCIAGGIPVTYSQRDDAKDHDDLTYNIAENNRSCVMFFYFGN